MANSTQNTEMAAADVPDASKKSTRTGAPRGFAAMDPAQQRRIASEGGRAAHASGNAHEFTSEEARAAAYTIPSYEDQYYSPDFGQSTGAAVPLDDYGYSDYR